MPDIPHFSNRRLTIDQYPVTELAAQFGTPLFVYDSKMIAERLDDLASFDVVRFAQKACSNITVLQFLRQKGAMIDAVSAMEVRRAIAAGYPISADDKDSPHPIVYTADIFDQDALELVAGEAPVHVNCGSLDMIWQLGERSPGRDITLRLNPGFGHGHSRKTNTGGDQAKHGIWYEEMARAFELASHFDLRITGLHTHIGSGTNMEHLSRVCDSMKQAAREAGDRIQTISCGGGLPVPYKAGESYVDIATYRRLWQDVIDFLEDAYGHRVRLEIEPGRYLVAESGYLVTEIRATKRQDTNPFYLCDAGFNNLARPIMYGAWHPMAIVCDPSEDRPEQDVIVGGPLCESGDIFTQEEGGFVTKRSLPTAGVGDLLVIENVGAYGSVMGSNYNSKPMATEVLLTDNGPKLIRKRQTFEQLIENEVLVK